MIEGSKQGGKIECCRVGFELTLRKMDWNSIFYGITIGNDWGREGEGEIRSVGRTSAGKGHGESDA